MPATQSATHPSGLRINFDEQTHIYEDENGVRYQSVTSFAGKFFESFDRNKIATEKAIEHVGIPGVTYDHPLVQEQMQKLLAEWEYAGVYGTKCHELMEWRIQQPSQTNALPPVSANNELESYAFIAIERAVQNLFSSGFTFAAAEQILFSRPYMIAGTADLLMWQGKTFWILDLKTNKSIWRKGFDNKRADSPIDHLPDCNGAKYALQLAIYERLIRDGGYVGPKTKINRALIHIPHYSTDPVFIPQPCMRMEVAEMLLTIMTPPF